MFCIDNLNFDINQFIHRITHPRIQFISIPFSNPFNKAMSNGMFSKQGIYNICQAYLFVSIKAIHQPPHTPQGASI